MARAIRRASSSASARSAPAMDRARDDASARTPTARGPITRGMATAEATPRRDSDAMNLFPRFQVRGAHEAQAGDRHVHLH